MSHRQRLTTGRASALQTHVTTYPGELEEHLDPTAASLFSSAEWVRSRRTPPHGAPVDNSTACRGHLTASVSHWTPNGTHEAEQGAWPDRPTLPELIYFHAQLEHASYLQQRDQEVTPHIRVYACD